MDANKDIAQLVLGKIYNSASENEKFDNKINFIVYLHEQRQEEAYFSFCKNSPHLEENRDYFLVNYHEPLTNVLQSSFNLYTCIRQFTEIGNQGKFFCTILN